MTLPRLDKQKPGEISRRALKTQAQAQRGLRCTRDTPGRRCPGNVALGGCACAGDADSFAERCVLRACATARPSPILVCGFTPWLCVPTIADSRLLADVSLFVRDATVSWNFEPLSACALDRSAGTVLMQLRLYVAAQRQ